MKKPSFVNDEIYHVYNRGVDKREVFLNDRDHFRFIHNLFEFNNTSPAANIFYKENFLNSYEVQLRKMQQRNLLVEILVFCLMPNHYHLVLQQRAEHGVVSFMQKLGTGYTNYFNKKYDRSGSLFQGRFKAVHVSKDSHFIHLPYYIHANPLGLIGPEWRERKTKNFEKSVQFLEDYRWSSFRDYLGIKNFPIVTQRDFLLEISGSTANYKKDFFAWLSESSDKDLPLDMTFD